MEENKLKISDIISKYDKEVEEIFNKIKHTKENEVKLKLYKQLLTKNDTKEEYILSYLLFIKEYDKINFTNILIEKQLYISEKNYEKYFKDDIKNRKCIRIKFLNLFEFLKNSPIKTLSEKNKILTDLLLLIKNEPKLKTKSEITWENKELYLNYLYLFLLNNIIRNMHKYNDEIETNDKFYDSLFFTNYIVKIFMFCLSKF